MDHFQEIVKVIAEYKDLDPSEITAERSFEDLGIDSLDAIDILYEVEDKFKIDVPQEALDFETMRTVGDILSVVETVLADQQDQQTAE
jgi:acyl carrier protein